MPSKKIWRPSRSSCLTHSKFRTHRLRHLQAKLSKYSFPGKTATQRRKKVWKLKVFVASMLDNEIKNLPWTMNSFDLLSLKTYRKRMKRQSIKGGVDAMWNRIPLLTLTEQMKAFNGPEGKKCQGENDAHFYFFFLEIQQRHFASFQRWLCCCRTYAAENHAVITKAEKKRRRKGLWWKAPPCMESPRPTIPRE